MATDTIETGLEKTIADYLVSYNDCEQAISADFNKAFAIDTEKAVPFLDGYIVGQGEGFTYHWQWFWEKEILQGAES